MKRDLDSIFPETGHKIGVRSVIQARQCAEVESSWLSNATVAGISSTVRIHFCAAE